MCGVGCVTKTLCVYASTWLNHVRQEGHSMRYICLLVDWEETCEDLEGGQR